MRASPDAGQASLEYVGLVALVSAVLAGVGAAAPELPGAVAGAVRLGICLVARDVCRPADARAAGLGPCVVDDRTRGGRARFTVVGISFGQRNEWAVARRSDGSYLVTRFEDDSVGAAGGIGLEASPLGIEVGLAGGYDLVLRSGRAWEVADAVAAARVLANRGDGLAPAWRFGDLGGELEASGHVSAIAEVAGIEASAAAAAGARVGGGRTTLYARAQMTGPDAFAGLPGDTRHHPLRQPRDVIAEYTRDAHGPLELAFRSVESGGVGGAGNGGARDGGEREGGAPRAVETVARLDLRDPANRAAVAPLLRRRLPWPPAALRDLRAAVRRAILAGTVERAVYAVDDRSHDIDLAARLGAELGVHLDRVHTDRRLLSASAWTPGSGERERYDCLRS